MAPVTCPDTTCREVADPHPLLHVSLCHVERIYGVYAPQPFTRSHKSFTHRWGAAPRDEPARDPDDADVRYLHWLGERLVDKVVVTTGEYAYRRNDGVAVIPLGLLA